MLEIWQQQVFIVGLIILIFTAFVREWTSPELVAIAGMFACVAVGILNVDPASANSALRLFGHPAPVTVAAMFVISAGLERTGVIEALGAWFEKIAGKGEGRALLVMILLVVVLSGLVNNTPVVVVFMPIVLRLCRRNDFKASRFLIPLSYAAIVGGTTTVIGTSTNLVATGIAREAGAVNFGIFDITGLGLIVAAVTVVYLMTVGRKLLPDRVTLAGLLDPDTSREFLTHAFVSDGPLAGKYFADTPLAKIKRVRVIDVIRGGKRLRQPLNEIVFAEGDELVLKGPLDSLAGASQTEGVAVMGEEGLGLVNLRTEQAVLMEGIIGPDSSMVGKSLRQLNFRQHYGVLIMAVHRRGLNLKESFEDVRLMFGDTVLVQGPAEKMRELFQQKDFINLSEPKEQAFRRPRAPFAIAAILGFMVLGATTDISVTTLALGAALLVLLSGCIETKEAYEAVDWKVIFLIIGMLGIGRAMQATQLDAVIATTVSGWFGGASPWVMVAAIYLLATVMTEIISNNAVAALVTPIAITLAYQMGVDPRGFIVAVMFGASASFMTPIGYQTNTFVYGAGGYKFTDFFRVGMPLQVLLWLLVSALIPLFWKF